jgi:cob(I)alamin adenosyltransferase
MKIYTKRGDSGQTSLVDGKRVSKASLRIDTYGTVDELNVAIGLLALQAGAETYRETLLRIQHTLFDLGSHLATSPDKLSEIALPRVEEAMVAELETEIDEMTEQLEPLRHFVLPGSCLANAYAHQARVVCRRAERLVVALNEVEAVEPVQIQYLNRLSDWLFVFSRRMSQLNETPEIKWVPKKEKPG